MTSVSEVLAWYAHLARTVARMRELALDRQWEQLPALDALCTGIFQQLRCVELEDLSPWEKAQVSSAASRIRADQEELRTLVRPQFVRLMQAMRTVAA